MKYLFFVCIAIVVVSSCINNDPSVNTDVDKIITAKQIVLSQLNYPDTADFHDMKTKVNGDNVTLVVTAKNTFGVPSTHTFSINTK